MNSLSLLPGVKESWAYLNLWKSLTKHHYNICGDSVKLYLKSAMMLKFLVIVAMVIANAVPDQNHNPELQELRNGVLVQDQGFILQGGGSAHALIKLNVTNLQFEVKKVV